MAGVIQLKAFARLHKSDSGNEIPRRIEEVKIKSTVFIQNSEL